MIMPRMDEQEDDIGSMSSFSDHEDSSNSVGSSASSEVTDDASSSNSSLSSSFQPPSTNDQFNEGPLFEMSDLLSDLPIKYVTCSSPYLLFCKIPNLYSTNYLPAYN
jgi:hypothetical protein